MKKSMIVMMILVAALLIAGCTQPAEPTEHVHALTKVEGIPATCTSTGTADYWTCSGCGILFADTNGQAAYVMDGTLAEQMITPMLPHDYADDGDCTTDDACKDCGAIREAEHEAHEAKADDGDCSTAITCKNCSVVLTEAKSHVGGTATCSTLAKCANCGKAYGTTNAGNHAHAEIIYAWSADFNTCTAAGKCADCGDGIYETVTTTYANGRAYADFAVPGDWDIANQVYVLNDYDGKGADQIEAAVAYMKAHGETDPNVMFPH